MFWKENILQSPAFLKRVGFYKVILVGIAIDTSELLLPNAKSSISITLSGIITVSNEEHSLNTLTLIEVIPMVFSSILVICNY